MKPTFFITLVVTVTVCEAYKLLLVFPFPGKSHMILSDGYVRHLLKAKHELTLITPMPMKNPPPNLRQIDVSTNFNLVPMDDILSIRRMMQNEVDINDTDMLFELMFLIANATVMHPNVQALLAEPHENFDAVIAEWLYTEIYSGFSSVFGCPLIWTSTMEVHHLALSIIDEDPNPAYTADIITADTPPYTFGQRIRKLFSLLFINFTRWKRSLVEQNVFTAAFSNAVAIRKRELPPLNEAKYKGSLMFGNSHVSIGQAVRLPQNYIPVAGYHINDDIKPLPEDLKKIIDNSKYGVIYFSMGSMLKSGTLPDELIENLLRMFGKLRQTVIWKFDQLLRNVSENVHVINWAPQLSILEHENCILFITHGGILSTIEAMHFGKPIVGIPVYADQFSNVQHAVAKKKGKSVPLDQNLVHNLMLAIEEVVYNPRNSRSLKDPNPLMSTMTNINMKFPITIKADKIDIEKIPQQLISGIPDNRRRGRILCKTDTIQWYIDNVEPDKGKLSSVEKMFEASAQKYKKVFEYPWENVSFKIGNVTLSRSLVPVNPNDVDIPKEFIKPAILQTLNLDNMIEYTDIPDYYLNQVKQILMNSNLDIRSLPNVLNYIISQMDKKYRFLPIINGLSPDFIYISHALVQPQYRATSLLAESSQKTGQNKSITELCINLIYYCRMNNIPYYKLREMINNFTFYGYPVQKIMQSTDENKYIRFVKGCMGLEITPVIEKPSIKFYPKQGTLFETTHSTKSGVEFRRYNGEEMVFFESSTSKGFFIHNADALLTITINRTNLKNLAFVLGQIAVFITKGFEFNKSPTMKTLRASIARQFTQKWWLVVGMEETAVRNVKKEIETGEGDVSMGALRFSDSIEIDCLVVRDCLVWLSVR